MPPSNELLYRILLSAAYLSRLFLFQE